jgi:uncharacterized damage-inducible protein DinB
MPTTADTIAELLERVLDGDPWYGSSTLALLADLSADEAAARPVAGAHSIWELVLHMTGWVHEVQQRLAGRAAQEPDGGDWPAVGAVTEARWQHAVARLAEAHRALVAAVRAADPDMLARPVLDTRDPALGTGLTRELTLHGAIHHTVYHSGQIALLTRTLRGRA